MAAANDSNLPPYIQINPGPNASTPTHPYPPSSVEAKCFYYGIPSRPILIARSSVDVWVGPSDLEGYIYPKESSPIGSHPLQAIWEATVGPAIVAYLDSDGVKWTSLDPVRMGEVREPSPPVIIWVGVIPGSLSAEDGAKAATHCKSILTTHAINNVHVEIRESEVIRSGKMYSPTPTSDPTARVKEPFSTALSLPICAEATPSIEGSGGFFIFDPRNPGKIYLVTARHVVFHADDDPNELYQYHNPSHHRRNVLLFGDTAIKKQIRAIEREIWGTHTIIKQLEKRLDCAEQMDEKRAEAERKDARPQLEKAKKAIGALETFLAEVSRDWRERKNRVLGHVILSPPMGFGIGEEEFTEIWAVIEMDASKIDSTNFVGNAIDLGTTIPIDEFTDWMCPEPPNWSSFEYPGDRCLEFHDTLSDEEMWKPRPRNLGQESDPCIMVLKRGYASDLTVGRLHTIRSFTKVYSKDHSGRVSKEVVVLPRQHKSSEFSPFSRPGDSGSAVVDGKGRLAGIITGGAGNIEGSDCTYVTSINFLLKRMSEYNLQANLSPSLDA